jgi:hypothetical protein
MAPLLQKDRASDTGSPSSPGAGSSRYEAADLQRTREETDYVDRLADVSREQGRLRTPTRPVIIRARPPRLPEAIKDPRDLLRSLRHRCPLIPQPVDRGADEIASTICPSRRSRRVRFGRLKQLVCWIRSEGMCWFTPGFGTSWGRKLAASLQGKDGQQGGDGDKGAGPADASGTVQQNRRVGGFAATGFLRRLRVRCVHAMDEPKQMRC